MAVGSGKMQPPCDSAEPALSRRPSARHHEPQQVQLRQKLRELPARLRSGLTLRRKNPAAGGRVSEYRKLEHLNNSSCAGRALRNIFTVQASDLIKDRVYLTGICRRSCVGSELVDWLLEHCPFVKCRSTAVGVWQLLLDMGIVLSVDRQLYFQDTHVFYQFSADECTYLFCEFERDEGWQNGVKFLLQLVPLTSPRAAICNLGSCSTSTLTSALLLVVALPSELASWRAAAARREPSSEGRVAVSSSAEVRMA
uniref:DEP domain-containing protein n=1 Tax=Gopherus agassizii TaxID=38772 RepID=A0A452GW31_9SAUR